MDVGAAPSGFFKHLPDIECRKVFSLSVLFIPLPS